MMNNNEINYSAQIKESVEHLFHFMEQRETPEDMARLRAAYALAEEAHRPQRRKTGEPYIIHPIAVARIVAEELELGVNPVIAAFLHDVVEDTPYTVEDIRQRFGDDIAFLVETVTKKKKDNYERSKQVDNYRQILESVQYDIRALLVKMADRLHNMRTLDSMRPDKQMKIAGETDYFYAPLANRLAMHRVKRELENLSFRYRCPQEFEEVNQMLEELKTRETPQLLAYAERSRKLLKEHGLDVRTEISFRTPYSIWRKMQKHGYDFRHAERKHYIRVIYDAPPSLIDEKIMTLRIYGILTDNFKEQPGSVVNYVNTPKENGYQSFHVNLLNEEGEWEEIHISSERMVRISRLGSWAEHSESNLHTWLNKFRNTLRELVLTGGEIDYMEGVTSTFYNEDITVITPSADNIQLPQGATAIDFAFEIHRDIGLHAVYARINGDLSSLKTVLHHGDVVEIGTQPNAYPANDWIEFAHTYKAKRSLRSFYAQRPKLTYNRCSCCHPLPGNEVIGFKESDGSITAHKRNCPVAIKLASQWGDSIVAIDFEKDDHFLYPVKIGIRAVDRYHLLIDILGCITDKLKLSFKMVNVDTVDNICDCTIVFYVHSATELRTATDSISAIDGVDGVCLIDIK